MSSQEGVLFASVGCPFQRLRLIIFSGFFSMLYEEMKWGLASHFGILPL
jgi:hypothetical protein